MKKYFKPCLIAVLVFALTFAFTTGIYAEVEPTRPENVDLGLWEYMQTANDDELIPINICLVPVDDAILREKIKSKLGTDPQEFMDGYMEEASFQGEFDELTEAEQLKIRKKYQIEKNKIVAEVQSAANDLFIATYVESRQNTVTYAGRYISSIYLTAKKSDVMFYAQIPEVISIGYVDPTLKIEPSM